MAWEQRVTISCVACFLRGGVQKIRLSSEDLKNGRECSDKLKYILGISIVRGCKVESRTGTPAVRWLGHGYRPNRSRLVGGGFKLPGAASVKSCGGERPWLEGVAF